MKSYSTVRTQQYMPRLFPLHLSCVDVVVAIVVVAIVVVAVVVFHYGDLFVVLFFRHHTHAFCARPPEQINH